MNKRLFYILLFFISFFTSTVVASAQAPYFRKHSLPQDQAGTGISVILQDSRLFLWLGTTNGLTRFDGIDYKQITSDTSSMSRITALYEDSKGQLWVGYKSGKIAIVKDDKFVELAPEEGFAKAPVTAFAEDGNKNIWFSTYGEGVYYIRNGRMYNVNTDDVLADNYTYDMALDTRGRVWVATDGGISVCSIHGEKKSVQPAIAEGSLPDKIVTAIERDGAGNMWIGTESMGCCEIQYSPSEVRCRVRWLELWSGKQPCDTW